MLDTAVALTEFFLGANLDPDVRAIVLTGTGRDYCTGADVVSNPQAAAAMTPLDYRFGTDAYRALFKALWEVERPVVSAVNGTVAGAGWTYAADRRPGRGRPSGPLDPRLLPEGDGPARR